MAHHRHKRDTDARPHRFTLPPARYLAGGLAVMATLASVGTGVVVAAPESPTLQAASSTTSAAGSISTTVDISDRARVVSRSQDRIDRVSPLDRMLRAEVTRKAVRQADTKRWTTTDLNLWTTPVPKTDEKVGLLEAGKKVLVTGRTALDRVELVVDGKSRWVTAGYLSEDKPQADVEAEAETGSAEAAIGGACTNGTAVDGQPNIIAVHQAVCAAFPQITSYGTYRGDGEHAQGLAIDIMVSGSTGWDVAELVRANYQELGVDYIIYSQQIWSVDRASEGWRPMEDRGSVTANHYDHVHVTTY